MNIYKNISLINLSALSGILPVSLFHGEHGVTHTRIIRQGVGLNAGGSCDGGSGYLVPPSGGGGHGGGTFILPTLTGYSNRNHEHNGSLYIFDTSSMDGSFENKQTSAHQYNEHSADGSQIFDLINMIQDSKTTAAGLGETITKYTVNWGYTLTMEDSYSSLCDDNFNINLTTSLSMQGNKFNDGNSKQISTVQQKHVKRGSQTFYGKLSFDYSDINQDNIFNIDYSASVYTYFHHTWLHSWATDDWSFKITDLFFSITPTATTEVSV